MDNKAVRLGAPCFLGAFLLPFPPAFAAAQPDETLVVTANAAAAMTIKDAPATLSFIDAQEQSKYQMTGDVGDLLVDVPGVNVSSQANGSRSVRIRGLSNDYTQVLLNGQRSYTREALWRGSDNALSLTPSVAIETIEVIRGPMGTLYGADTMGGVVNVITRKHNGVAEGSVSVEGQYNQGDKGGNGQVYGLYFSTPVTDAVSYTVYGNYLNVDETFYSSRPEFTKLRSQDNYNVVNNLEFALNENHTLELEAQLSKEHQIGSKMWGGRGYEQDRGLENYSLGYGFDSSSVSVDANLHYSNFDITYDNPSSDITEKNYGGDVKAYTYIGQHSIAVGGESHKDRINSVGINGGSTERTSSAAFVEGNLEVTDSTLVTLGGRYDTDSLFDSEFTYRGYLNQTVNGSWNIKAGVGTAFKAPTMAQISPSYTAPGCGGNCTVFGNPDLKAETGTFGEVGAYYSGSATNINATLFHNQIDDIIQQVRRADGNFTFVNVDKATLKGLELFASHEFSHVGLEGSYTYLDASDDTDGSRLVGTSEHEATARVNGVVDQISLKKNSAIYDYPLVSNGHT
ncbi:TonB-dependent siderophore receptor, partial [uncultured Vibrio sp.]|uniref:TonB-dependent receptor plug domain-containing protein n=1 Tax=uncultured Vibrio sp. TaxID=114054 RepID=UPI002636F361